MLDDLNLKDDMFEDIKDIYNSLEPPGMDTWNPLIKENELWHRMRLFHSFKWAFDIINKPVGKLKILDFGCGNGRSTRFLLEFGVRPENILGVDIRKSSIEYAKMLNANIKFEVVNDLSDLKIKNAFDICMQCTVFSSIPDIERRINVANNMINCTVDQGYIFWWDRINANKFAGGDFLDFDRYFMNCSIVKRNIVSIKPTFNEASRSESKKAQFITNICQNLIGCKKTHTIAVLQKNKI